MNGEPLSWKIKTLRGQLIDLGSAISVIVERLQHEYVIEDKSK
jgi:hypothetical protein